MKKGGNENSISRIQKQQAKALPLPAGLGQANLRPTPKVISSLALQPTKQPAEQPPKGATQFVLQSTALALQSTVKPSSQPSLRQPLSREHIQSAPQWSPQPVVHQVVQPPVQPAVKPPPTLVSASFRSGAAVRKDITSQMAQAEEAAREAAALKAQHEAFLRNLHDRLIACRSEDPLEEFSLGNLLHS